MQSPKGDEEEAGNKPSRATVRGPRRDEVGAPPSRPAARGKARRSDPAWSLSNNGGVTVEAIRSGIDLSYVDAGARPQDDLFGYVNGRWLADHRMPADRATDGAFRLLADRAEEQVRDIITEAAAANAADGTDPQRIGDLYASFMDTETIAGLGVRPLLDELAGVDAALTPAQLAAELGELQRTGIGGGTGVYVDTDAKDSTRYLLHMSQSGLGLPDESYYRDPQHAAILAEYPKHIARMFALVYGEQDSRLGCDRRPDRRPGDQDRGRALGCGEASRRRSDLQPAYVRPISLGGNRFRLGRVAARVGR